MIKKTEGLQVCWCVRLYIKLNANEPVRIFASLVTMCDQISRIALNANQHR